MDNLYIKTSDNDSIDDFENVTDYNITYISKQSDFIGITITLNAYGSTCDLNIEIPINEL